MMRRYRILIATGLLSLAIDGSGRVAEAREAPDGTGSAGPGLTADSEAGPGPVVSGPGEVVPMAAPDQTLRPVERSQAQRGAMRRGGPGVAPPGSHLCGARSDARRCRSSD